MPARNVWNDRGTIYVSGAGWKLRLVSLVCWVPAVLCAWLIPLAPREEWAAAPLGSLAWWVPPAILILFSLSLVAALIPLHGRYVTHVAFAGDGRLRVTTFLLWGLRTERLQSHEIAARRFRLNRGGEAPLGFDVLWQVGFVAPD